MNFNVWCLIWRYVFDKTNKLHPDDLWGCDYAYHLAWNIYISRIFCLVSAGHLSRATHKDNWQLAAVTRCNHVCCLERRWRCRGRYFHTLSSSQHQHSLRAELGYRHFLASQSWKCSNLVWWEVRLRAMRVPISSVQCPVSSVLSNLSTLFIWWWSHVRTRRWTDDGLLALFASDL